MLLNPVRSFRFFNETPTTESTQQQPVDKTYTEAEVKAMIENGKKQTENLARQLEAIAKAKETSEQEKVRILKELEDFRNQGLSKEEIAKAERQRILDENQRKLKELEGDRDNWRKRFESSTITTQITEAAVNTGAYSPSQILALLQANASVDPDSGSVRIMFEDIIEGKPTKVPLSPMEVLTRMKTDSARYGNLFLTNGKSGIGGNAAQPPGEVSLEKMTFEDYKKMRGRT